MNSHARRFLSWTFIITFFVLAPVIILSTAGYRYNFERGRLERTGVVVVESRPAGASISLNGKPQKAETPAHLGKVTPGTYAVRVEKAGYQSWTKTVSVGSRETVFLNRISLFRAEAPNLFKETGAQASAAFSADARYGAAVASASSGSELTVIDTKTGAAHLPYRSSATASSLTMHWSPNGRFLLITRTGTTPSFLVWSANDPESVRDLSTSGSAAFDEAFWAQDADRLYASAKGTLYEIDTASLTSSPTGPSINQPVIANGILYGISVDGSPALVRRALNQNAFETIAQLPSAGFSPVAGGDRRITYASLSSDKLFTIDPSGDRPTAFEGRGHDGAWSADGSRLLYWNEFELRLYDARAGSDELINRVGSPIARAAWQRPEWTAIYASGTTLYAIETTDTFGRVIAPLAEFETVQSFAISSNGDLAFVFGMKNGVDGLWKLRLR